MGWAGLSGEKKMGTTNRAKSGIRHGPGSSAKILKTPRKRWENKVFWKMLRFWSPQKSPETFKTLGKTRFSGQKCIPPGGGKRINPYKTNGNGVFCPKERQAHGHPLASPRRGKKMGAAWRPWPGLAQACLSGENKMDYQKSGIRFFFPAP